jgi:hypothetical protein
MDVDTISNNTAQHTFSDPNLLCNVINLRFFYFFSYRQKLQGCQMTGSSEWANDCQVTPNPGPPPFPVGGIIGITGGVAAIFVIGLAAVFIFLWKRREARWKARNFEIKELKKAPLESGILASPINDKHIDTIDKLPTKAPTEKNPLLTDYD